MQDLCIPMFIPRQVASLYSSIARYEQFLLREGLYRPIFCLKTKSMPNLPMQRTANRSYAWH